jgi:hypothetical protein
MTERTRSGIIYSSANTSTTMDHGDLKSNATKEPPGQTAGSSAPSPDPRRESPVVANTEVLTS